MTEEYTIQCEQCGTIYPDTDEVCPYCGQPTPPVVEYYVDRTPPEPLPDEFESHYQPQPATTYAEDYPFDDPLTDAYSPAADEMSQAGYEYDESGDTYDQAGYEEYYEEEAEPAPRRATWPRVLLGCVGLLACIALFYGGIGLVATYQGLQEHGADLQNQADEHYRRGVEHLDKNELDLAVAEFELALSLNPNLRTAREALREAQRLAQSRPTPTSETRLAAVESLLNQAETYINQQNWAEAVKTLIQVRGLDPTFQPEHVSDLFYQANYQLGLQQLGPDQINEALSAFTQALAERPNDEAAMVQKTRASLFRDGKAAAAQNQFQQAVQAFSQLYQQDSNYLDVKQRLFNAYVQFGDQLAATNDWCQAEPQYTEAVLLQPDESLRTKAAQSRQRCQDMPVQSAGPPPPRPTTSAAAVASTDITATATITPAAGGGRIFFSAFNPNESRWEILAVPVSGGPPQVIVINGTMPALSPNRQLLVYHSELIESEGLHRLDLTTGQDSRLTMFKQHILPRWGGDNAQFIFVAQEAGTHRWQIYLDYGDGKSEPVILRDGRTPDLSPDNQSVTFQGTDSEGNNPGLYLAAVSGGEATRLTNHESDRSPDFSPDGSRLAYMSTRSGNWDIYTISTDGSAPQQITLAPGNDGLPAWSPDGQQIAFVSDMDGSWGIYVVSASGGIPRKVITWDGSNRADWLQAQIDWTR